MITPDPGTPLFSQGVVVEPEPELEGAEAEHADAAAQHPYASPELAEAIVAAETEARIADAIALKMQAVRGGVQ